MKDVESQITHLCYVDTLNLSHFCTYLLVFVSFLLETFVPYLVNIVYLLAHIHLTNDI